MDILTQGLLGGVLAQAVARQDEKRIATLAGGVAGLLADADILISSASDPLLNVEYHRHFSHALVFIPLGAALALLLLWPLLHRRLGTARLYLFCLAGYSMSGVLDACTSYGTHLFWPFTDTRVALNIISIIDPVFTLTLLLTLILGLRLTTRRVAQVGLVLCVSYLGLGFVQLQRAEAVAAELRAARGHLPVQTVVKPTLANLVLWRSVYVHEQRIYVDAIRVGMLGGTLVFPGESVEQFTLETAMPGLDVTSVLYSDIQRFRHFSDDYLALDPTQVNVLGDIRYSLLPTSAKPLWGIVMQPERPALHADYRFYRQTTQELRQSFINQLLGRCATVVCQP